MVEGLVGARRRLLEVVEHACCRDSRVLWLPAESCTARRTDAAVSGAQMLPAPQLLLWCYRMSYADVENPNSR